MRRVSLDIRSGTGNEAWVDARARAACACVAAAYALFKEIVDAAAGSAAPVSVCRVDVVHRAASDVCELLNPLNSKASHEIIEELRTRTAAVLAVAIIGACALLVFHRRSREAARLKQLQREGSREFGSTRTSVKSDHDQDKVKPKRPSWHSAFARGHAQEK